MPDGCEVLALREGVHGLLVVHANALQVVERRGELLGAVLAGRGELEHLGRQLLDVLLAAAGLRLNELHRILELGRRDHRQRADSDHRQGDALAHLCAGRRHAGPGALHAGGRPEHPGGGGVAGQLRLLLHQRQVAHRLLGAGAVVGREDADDDGHQRSLSVYSASRDLISASIEARAGTLRSSQDCHRKRPGGP